MSNCEKGFIVTAYARNLIRFKARQLCRRADFHSVEREEVEQRLWLMLTAKADQFRAGRASIDTYVDRIIATAVAMLIREQQCKKRWNGRRTQSLDQIVKNPAGEPEPMSAAISEDDLARRVGQTRSDENEEREVQEAIADALKRMTPDERALCRRVMGGSITSAARDNHISRRQIRRLMHALCPYLERAGFDFWG